MLARGAAVPEALATAKRFVHEGLEMSADWTLGAGHGPVGKHGAWR
jgi:hydroxymethylpyrimidine/phosphomethylpyrimidine kinase